MMKIHRYALMWLAVAIILTLPSAIHGHTPYQPTVDFFHYNFPDRPIAEFAIGKLGILQPTWNRGYLVVFYRYLIAKPLSPAERASFLAREELHPASALKPVKPVSNNRWENKNRKDLPPQQWVKARAQFRKDDPPTSGTDKSWWSYTAGDNCMDDSFLTAIRTLRDRAKKYGAQSGELRDWIGAQDQVYLNCSWGENGRPHDAVIPAELPAGAGALARADRAYQIAAAHFYAKNFDEAIHRFTDIAKDVNSPWHDLATYLVARTALRKAVAFEWDLAPFDPKQLVQADASLQTAFDQITDRRLKKSIAGLRQYVALRLRPEEEYRSLAQQLSNGGAGERFGQDVVDLGFLLNRTIGRTPDFPNVKPWSDEYATKEREWRNRRFDEIREQRTASNLTDWVLTVKWNTPSAARHAVDRWQKQKSLPWLVAALLVTHGKDTVAGAIIEAAAQVPPESPAYPMVTLHRARLLRERGDIIAARRVLDEAKQYLGNWPISANNLWKQERFRVAESVDEFVRLLPRQPVGFDNGMETKGENEYCSVDSGFASARSVRCENGIFEGGTHLHLLPQIDDQSALILNQSATLDLLIAVARFESLPENIRKQLAPAVWARAVILDRRAEAATIAGVAGAMRPELKPYIDEYQKAATAEERIFLAAYAIAHFPGLRPAVNGSAPRVTLFNYADNYRDNWWCSDGLPRDYPWWVHFADLPTAPAPSIAFLSGAERARATDEFRHIVALGPAGDWLSNTLIGWAKAHPKDPRSAEALHFAWRAIRYSCDRKENRSREVFVLLHRLYPDSAWTKKTNIWW
jgi:hypothetical protein